MVLRSEHLYRGKDLGGFRCSSPQAAPLKTLPPRGGGAGAAARAWTLARVRWSRMGLRMFHATVTMPRPPVCVRGGGVLVKGRLPRMVCGTKASCGLPSL